MSPNNKNSIDAEKFKLLVESIYNLFRSSIDHAEEIEPAIKAIREAKERAAQIPQFKHYGIDQLICEALAKAEPLYEEANWIRAFYLTKRKAKHYVTDKVRVDIAVVASWWIMAHEEMRGKKSEGADLLTHLGYGSYQIAWKPNNYYSRFMEARDVWVPKRKFIIETWERIKAESPEESGRGPIEYRVVK